MTGINTQYGTNHSYCSPKIHDDTLEGNRHVARIRNECKILNGKLTEETRRDVKSKWTCGNVDWLQRRNVPVAYIGIRLLKNMISVSMTRRVTLQRKPLSLCCVRCSMAAMWCTADPQTSLTH